MVKRLRDKKIVPQHCLDLKIVKQGGGEVMIKKDQDTEGVSYSLGLSIFTGEECSWGLYHLEAISTQLTGSHTCFALTNLSK